MRKFNLFVATFLLATALSAQGFKIPVDKKLQASADSKMTMTMNAMGQEVAIETENTIRSEYTIKNVTANGYTLNNLTKGLKIKTSTMGTDITIDSDNEEDRKNPAYAEAFNSLNVPTDIIVEDNKAMMTGNAADKIQQLGMGSMMESMSDMTRFLLTDKLLSKLTVGNHWTDSSVNKEASIVNEYTVEKNDANGIALIVKTSLKINTTITQGGMEAKTSMHGNIYGHRLYNKITGVLSNENADTELEGSVEVMGQAMPMNMKMKTVTVIN